MMRRWARPTPATAVAQDENGEAVGVDEERPSPDACERGPEDHRDPLIPVRCAGGG
ncbi:MAG: hypothetical protein ACOYD0_09315 [Candidatus Nanopelagicales bacterium]